MAEFRNCEEYVLNELKEAQDKVEELEEELCRYAKYILILVDILEKNGIAIPKSADLEIKKVS